ncbi:MAG TPA: RNA-binding protein [Sandaracinaceae bacterium LLY-WYZ-13_1]|nr:RNA-binding protein [Sandaracinaceae bacterium LLY-WYZ-13_1]
MTNKLFVGGLAWATNDQGLRSAFEAFGEVVDAKVITDRETGRSRGFGFVTFADADSARQAMEEMDGQELDGRNLRVNEAQERRGGGRGGDRRGGRGPGGGDRRGGGPRNYPPVERRGGYGGPPPAHFDGEDGGKPAGRKRHNGGGRRRRRRDDFGDRDW